MQSSSFRLAENRILAVGKTQRVVGNFSGRVRPSEDLSLKNSAIYSPKSSRPWRKIMVRVCPAPKGFTVVVLLLGGGSSSDRVPIMVASPVASTVAILQMDEKQSRVVGFDICKMCVNTLVFGDIFSSVITRKENLLQDAFLI
jgi:hypothetical protein